MSTVLTGTIKKGDAYLVAHTSFDGVVIRTGDIVLQVYGDNGRHLAEVLVPKDVAATDIREKGESMGDDFWHAWARGTFASAWWRSMTRRYFGGTRVR